MRAPLFLVLSPVLLVFLVSGAGCGKSSAEVFCSSYQESFVKTCTEVCTKKAGAGQDDACKTKCKEALPQDATFKQKCGGG